MFWGDSESSHMTSRVTKQSTQALAQPPSQPSCTLCPASSIVPGCHPASHFPPACGTSVCRTSSPHTYADLATVHNHSLWHLQAWKLAQPKSPFTRPGPAACWRRSSNLHLPTSSKFTPNRLSEAHAMPGWLIKASHTLQHADGRCCNVGPRKESTCMPSRAQAWWHGAAQARSPCHGGAVPGHAGPPWCRL